ncbi:hypothetical protein [Fluviicola sp.]|uniref:hypothetical protein n=1 Tax=Fluviicola sp. TaxID=1917219 RepID=UPI0031E1E380
MKNALFTCFFLLAFGVSAQTSAELIGKWQLVKWTQNGKEKNLKDHFHTDQVFQLFLEDKNKFQSIVGDEIHKGKWKLSADGKTLTIVAGILPIPFTVDYFDKTRRVITYESVGTFEYTKVAD